MSAPHPLLSILSMGLLATSAAALAQAPEVRYLPFEDKGVSGDLVVNSSKKYSPARPTPRATFIPADELSKTNRKQENREEKIDFKLLERSGKDQTDLPVRFGFPFTQGQLFQPDKLQLFATGEEDQRLPLEVHVLALWPDGSVKSALLQTRLDLKADEEKGLQVVVSKKSSRKAPQPGSVRIKEGKNEWVIRTGKIKVTVPVANFELFTKVETDSRRPRLLAENAILRLADENDLPFASNWGPVESLVLEQDGELEAVIRAEGSFYAKGGKETLMRYIARMRFFAESSRMELSLTIVNNAMENEFNDLRTLELDLTFPAAAEIGQWTALIPADGRASAQPDSRLTDSGPLVLSQWEELRQSRTVGEEIKDDATGRAPGSAELRNGEARVQFAYKDFWQRWPKQLRAENGKLTVSLLPRISENFEAELPVHLQYPFIKGRHRSKWGMSFTERMAFDFDAPNDLETLQGSIQTPPMVRYPLDYLAKTEVLGPLPTKSNDKTQLWLGYAERSMEAFLAHRETARQFGYFNWGDWFGERGCNWGNNEYDIPHGFFTQYAHTGDPKFFDAAMEGARHQADVDIVHAYPDPFYIGANVQHSIGHTGISYQDVTPKTWTYKYDQASWGGNGHTWADGMADCWLLTGDPVVMDAMLALGDHVTFAYLGAAKGMGNHHRSIGWCLQSLAAFYRASTDPVYLKAMKDIVELPIDTWDAKTGIWPYELHPNHAMQKSGIIGSSVYNLGILMHGLAKYHALTGDERVVNILSRSSDWLVTAWQNETGWPYGARADGSLIVPNQRLAENLNPLIYPALAYTALITDHPKAADVAGGTITATFTNTTYDPLPKEYSIKSYATLETLGLLEQAEARKAATTPANP